MLAKCLEEIARLLDMNISEADLGQPLFSDPRYQAKPLHADNFHGIDPGKARGCRIAAVDGGNLEVLRAPNFSVSQVRVFFSLFRGEKRVDPERIPQMLEFFVLALVGVNEGKIHYSGILVPSDEDFVPFLPSGKHLMVDCMDRTLCQGPFRADISVVGPVMRRFTEWSLASRVIEEELDEGDILVRDGTLQTAVKNERFYADQAYEAALKKGVVLSGVAKTSTLLTNTGHSLIAAVNQFSKISGMADRAWYYHPIAVNNHPDHPAEMYISRLHDKTRYVFRTEVLQEQVNGMSGEELTSVFADLADNSRDLGLLGYPYALAVADKHARVTYNEKKSLMMRCRSALADQKCFDKVASHLCAADAHDLLDRL